MPLGKYYCEKQFQDTAAARKRHLQGAQHQRAPPGPGPYVTVQQTNDFDSQSNFVGYQAAERNPFSGNILGGHTSWGNLLHHCNLHLKAVVLPFLLLTGAGASSL